MNPAETAIAHNQNMIAGLGVASNGLNQLFQIIVRLGFSTKGGECCGRIPTQIRAKTKYVVSSSQALG